MEKELSSLGIYNKKMQKYGDGRVKQTYEDLEILLRTIKSELIINSNSPLLDIAYNECVNYLANQGLAMIEFEGDNIYFFEQKRRSIIPTYDAWQIIVLLSDYMCDDLSSKDLEKALPCFRRNYVPRPAYPNVLLKALETIDKQTVELRRKIYDDFIGKNDNINNKTGNDIVITELVKKEIGDKVQSFIMEAEEKKKAIIAQAEVRASEIIDNASLNAERKIAEANKRAIAVTAKKKSLEYEAEQQNIEQRFGEVREALVKANESIKCLEDSVSESVTKKAYTQLIELYNLIADTKDSTYTLAIQSNSKELENASYNMDVFLDMLVEYLADYGVRPIVSFQGECFSAKHHLLAKTETQYDPRNASIARSIRNGFIWGEQVIQKERVEIEGDKNVSRH